MSTYIISREDYLAHHGIKGQKWGVRRFQNSDGSLKPAGAKRYDTNGQHQVKKTRLEKKLDKANTNEDKFKAKDVFLARKLLKKSKSLEGARENYNKVSTEHGKKLFKADLKDSNEGTGKNYGKAWDEAQKAVKEALLKDAGFSEKKAKLGAEWMTKHNWNITFTDMSKVYDEERKHWNNY